MASEVGKSQVSKTLNGKKIWVSVDNSIDEVVSWDQDGATLLFHHEPGRFLDLDAKKLTASNRKRYEVASEMNKEAPESGEDSAASIMNRIDFDIQGMSALTKMDLPRSSKWKYGWRTADTLAEAISKGYQVVSDEETVVNPSGKGESHLVGKNNKTEQIMVKIRRDKYVENQRKGDAAIEAFVNGEDERMRESINRQAAGSELDADPRTKLTEAES